MPSINVQKILLFSEDIDLLGELYLNALYNNFIVEACNDTLELPTRAQRFTPDILIVDNESYLRATDFSRAVKVIKGRYPIRVILLVKKADVNNPDNNVIDEVRFLSKVTILDLLGCQ